MPVKLRKYTGGYVENQSSAPKRLLYFAKPFLLFSFEQLWCFFLGNSWGIKIQIWRQPSNFGSSLLISRLHHRELPRLVGSNSDHSFCTPQNASFLVPLLSVENTDLYLR